MENNLSMVDVLILAAYLLALVGIGAYFSRRQVKLEDFFLARHGVTWLPIGFSLMAALNSGIDYIMVPSMMIKFGAVILVVNLSWLLLYPYVFFITLPMFRKLQVYSAYEYLEHRFGLGVRGLGATIFVLWRLGWMATALYVPCLAISSVVGREDLLLPMLIALGTIVTFSTMLGGIKGVIWTNVLQFCVMFGGLAGTLIVAWYHVPGGMREIAACCSQVGTSQMHSAASLPPAAGHWFSSMQEFFTIPVTAIGLIIAAMVARVATYTTDQVMIQQLQTTRSIRDARQGFLVTALSDTLWMTSLAGVGLCLFAYSQHNPLPDAIRANPDQVFPYFMSYVFPAGITGLVIAAILAAGLSSIASAMNSITAVTMIDFYKRICLGQRQTGENLSERDERRNVLVSRLITVGVGVIGTTLACNVARLGTIFEIANKIINGFTGPLLGIFLLGMFTRRANGVGVFCGGFIGTAVTLWTIHLSNQGIVSFLWPSTFGLLAALIVGYVGSVIWSAVARGDDSRQSAMSRSWTWATVVRGVIYQDK